MNTVEEHILNEHLAKVIESLIKDEISGYYSLIKNNRKNYIKYFNNEFKGRCNIKFQIHGLINLYLDRNGTYKIIDNAKIDLMEVIHLRIDEINEFLFSIILKQRKEILLKILNHPKTLL